jgi:hypothetical protein
MKRQKPRKQRPLGTFAGPALRRAAKDARKHARMHGTAIAYMKDGKIVIEKP